MVSETITIICPDGVFTAYLATPSITPAPAVVVIQEIFGVNADMRATCDELAAAGFLAICPDLFWRLEPGLDLNGWTDEEWKKGLALNQAFDRDQGVRDIMSVVAFAHDLPGATGRVAVMGFCIGGLITFLTAARHNIDAAVAYHGGETEAYLSEAPGITAPFLMHLAEEDEFIGKDAQATITTALGQMTNVQIHNYPGCMHAFSRHTGVHYDAAAASLARSRTRAFLKQHLGPVS